MSTVDVKAPKEVLLQYFATTKAIRCMKSTTIGNALSDPTEDTE
jgi:hypothetical protein